MGQNLFVGKADLLDSYYWGQQGYLNDFKDALGDANPAVVKYGDVWIRDIAPIVTSKMVKFLYAPRYLEDADAEYFDERFINWLDEQPYQVTYSDIVLDGGNVVFNGEDTLTMSKRILADNPDYYPTELVQELKRLLAVKKVVLIDEEPGDVLGHADGEVAFLAPKKLLLRQFPGYQKVQQTLTKELPDTKIILIPDGYVDETPHDQTIPSALGVYVNILVLDNVVYVPSYGLDLDKDVLAIIKSETEKDVVQIDMSNLATLGGSLRCLTWVA